MSNSYKWRKASPAVLPLSFSLPSSTALISSALIRPRTKGMWYPSVEWSPITPFSLPAETLTSNEPQQSVLTQTLHTTTLKHQQAQYTRVWGFQSMSYCICNRSFHMHFCACTSTSQTQLLHMEGGKGQNPLNWACEIWPCQYALIVHVNATILHAFHLNL